MSRLRVVHGIKEYRVIKDFISRTNGQVHRIGEVAELTVERAEELLKLGYIAQIEEVAEAADEACA